MNDDMKYDFHVPLAGRSKLPTVWDNIFIIPPLPLSAGRKGWGWCVCRGGGEMGLKVLRHRSSSSSPDDIDTVAVVNTKPHNLDRLA